MLNGNDLELLSAYLDGALSEADRTALEGRLQTDADLRRELARLRATVDLIKTLPTLSAPRPLTLTPRMVRRPNIVTSAAFSALSAAAAIILLVIGASLFTRLPPAAPSAALRFGDAVAAAPTTSAINEPAQGGANNAVLPPVVDNFQSTLAKTTTELGQESTTGMLGFAAPTATAQPSIEAQLYAAPMTLGTSAGEDLSADSSLAQSQQAQPSPSESPADQRTQAEQAAPSSAMDGAGAASAVQAPLPAPTLLLSTPTVAPTKIATATPSDTPSPTEIATLTNTPSPTASALPTLAPTLVPLETPATESNIVGIGLIALALVLFGLAIVTTVLRRRS